MCYDYASVIDADENELVLIKVIYFRLISSFFLLLLFNSIIAYMNKFYANFKCPFYFYYLISYSI